MFDAFDLLVLVLVPSSVSATGVSFPPVEKEFS